jgi:anthranilate/para-aminobenzoate synthase component I
MCAGGWVWYFSYDTEVYREKKLPFSAVPDDDVPDIHLGLYNDVLVFDHVSKVLPPPVAFLSLILLLCIFQHT